MTKEQKTAIKAMMYAFDKYGVRRLADSAYVPDRINHPEYTMNFLEAYNICGKMVREESGDKE